MIETSNFRLEEINDSSGRKIANRWTLTLTDWMAYYFQHYIFPFNQIDYLACHIEKTQDGRSRYQFDLDQEATQHFR